MKKKRRLEEGVDRILMLSDVFLKFCDVCRRIPWISVSGEVEKDGYG